MLYHTAIDVYSDLGFISGVYTIENNRIVSDKAWHEVVEEEITKVKAANPTASSVELRWVKEYANA